MTSALPPFGSSAKHTVSCPAAHTSSPVHTTLGSPCDSHLSSERKSEMRANCNGIGVSQLTYGSPVGLNRCVWVLHLNVLVAHERPGGQMRRIQLDGTLEVLDRLLVFATYAVIVAWKSYPQYSNYRRRRVKKTSTTLPMRLQTSGRSLSARMNLCARSLSFARDCCT